MQHVRNPTSRPVKQMVSTRATAQHADRTGSVLSLRPGCMPQCKLDGGCSYCLKAASQQPLCPTAAQALVLILDAPPQCSLWTDLAAGCSARELWQHKCRWWPARPCPAPAAAPARRRLADRSGPCHRSPASWDGVRARVILEGVHALRWQKPRCARRTHTHRGAAAVALRLQLGLGCLWVPRAHPVAAILRQCVSSSLMLNARRSAGSILRPRSLLDRSTSQIQSLP